MKRSLPRPHPRKRGMALLMALAVVMLLTFFLSEYFFATGLELRALGTFKDAKQASGLARSVFKALQLALLQDEAEFFQGYRELSKLLVAGAIPWDNGLVLTLEVRPQDHLFNLNQNHNLQPGQPQDIARSQVFLQLLEDHEVPSRVTPGIQEPLDASTILSLYAALYDWVDADDDEYVEFTSVRGAEYASYQGDDLAFEVKNGMLDRLEEIRLVKGVVESGIPWALWEQTVTALPKNSQASFYLTERINVNVATAEEIQRFLESRRVDPSFEGANKPIHDALNGLADRAAEIAEYFAPTGEERRTYSPAEIQRGLEELGLADQAKYGKNHALTAVNQFYRVRIVAQVAEVRSRLEAMLEVRRDENTRVGTAPKVLWISQN